MVALAVVAAEPLELPEEPPLEAQAVAVRANEVANKKSLEERMENLDKRVNSGLWDQRLWMPNDHGYQN
jgi:hypothetical protein